MENELKRYGLIIGRWAWLIALVMLLAAGAAFVASRLARPVYAASTTLLINQAPSSGRANDYSSILTSERLASTYSAMMTKRPALDEAIASLQIDTSADQLARQVSVNLVRDTQLIQVKVEDEDPQRAADLANAIPAAFSRQNAELQANRYADSKANLTKEIDSVKQQISEKQAEVAAIGTSADSAKEAELARLQTELIQLRQSSANLLQSYESIRLAEAQSTNDVVVVEKAERPDRPVRPQVVTNTILGGVVGLLLALGVVFLMEYLDDRIRSPEQAERLLVLPTVGLIAKMDPTADKSATPMPVAVREPRSPIVEAFRSLRTNIQFAGVDHPIRTLLVTSAGPSEGKSTIAANLAVVMAQSGLRVILMDGDLRRPTVHKIFGQPNRAGLTSVMLQDPSQWNGVPQSTPITNLATVLSGALPPNPSELLGSKRMKQFIDYLHKWCDIVIIDAPPLLPVTDALVLSPLTDGVIMVIDSGSTRIGEAVNGKRQLDQAGARVLGVVMNKIPTGRHGYYYYRHYRYQHYYQPDGDQNGKRSRSKRNDVRPADEVVEDIPSQAP